MSDSIRHLCPVCKSFVSGRDKRHLFLGVCKQCQDKVIDNRRKELENERFKLNMSRDMLRDEREELEMHQNAMKLYRIIKDIAK